jgi:hypothetical protein
MFLCRPVGEIYDGCIITFSLKIRNQYVSATKRMETADKAQKPSNSFHLFACLLQLTCKNELIQNKIDLQKRSQLRLDVETGPCITGQNRNLKSAIRVI